MIKGYITEKQLKEGLVKLDNAQDKFVVLALYKDLCGKNPIDDLTKLKSKDVDFEKNIINISDRQIEMDEEFSKITKDAINQTIYYTEAIAAHTVEEFPLNPNSEYVIKTKMSSKTKNGTESIRYSSLRSRLYTIGGKAGFDCLPSTLKTSGIINELLKEKKYWTVMEIEFALRLKNIKANAHRIYTVIKQINNQ